ncbi:uncharacterized protein LOC128884467 [Hylaeus volcanicus]|uniref:uncharacterized protein LOC128884467 n=1 Tax=Hylaeus volcanicus TaxID=313075 RepID=UPI0023B7E64D|nr:uncharacterized protein LOC128884467 [Hylaeus volcanicus]
MDAKAFQQQYNLAVRKLDAFLFKVSDGVSLQESDTFEVVLSTLHCALYVREQARKENKVVDFNEKKKISTEWFQQVNEGLVERFMSLTWSGNPFCQRLALTIFFDLLHVDLLGWIEGCTRFMPDLLQSSNPLSVYYALNYGLVRYLSVLESYLKKNSNTILPMNSLEIFTNILLVFVREIQKLLIGAHISSDVEPVMETKISNLSNDSYTLSINSLISSNVGLKIVKQISIFLQRTICLQRFQIDNFPKNYNQVAISCLNTIIHLLIYPLGAQRTSHYIIIIESLCDIILMKTLQIRLLMSCLKTFGFLCLCVSLPYNDGECYLLNPLVLKKHSQTAPMVVEMLKDWIVFFEKKKKYKRRSILEFCSNANRRNPLRVIMGLQIMKLLASTPTKNDLLSDLFLFQCMSLLSDMVSSTFFSISSLRHQAESLYISGLFKTSILDVKLPVNTVALSTSECHDQSICFDDGEGFTEQFGLPCKKKNIDVVAWLTSVKSHEDVVELIMKNFLKKLDNSSIRYVDEITPLDSHPAYVTTVNDTNVVVAAPVEISLTEGFQNPGGALEVSLHQLKSTVSKELEALYKEEKCQSLPENKINIEQPDLNMVDFKISLDDILTSPKTEKMIVCTPLSFIKKHQEAPNPAVPSCYC